MDPLSATANVLTLLEAVDKIRRKLISLRHAPDEWLALNNEEGLKELDQQLKEMRTSSLGAQFYRQLEKTEKIFSDLDKFIAYKLTKIDGYSGQPTVDRSIWLRSERKVDRFKAQIQKCKIDLNSTISMLNM
ncbi:MAG: hypothetical protein LQ342_005397 [Letrouitia transgressa]|nr:MAG: hypothetical protein LQ342_005397 [Letrouitia transgressa]